MFYTSFVTVYPNGCMLTSYGKGLAYSLKYKEYDGWVEQETAFLQRDLQVWEFERLLDECNSDDDVFALFQRYHYGELPTDYDVLAYEESIPIDDTEQTEYVETNEYAICMSVNDPVECAEKFSKAFDEWQDSLYEGDTQYCSDHCDSCGGEYRETVRNDEYLMGPYWFDGRCVCHQCRGAVHHADCLCDACMKVYYETKWSDAK